MRQVARGHTGFAEDALGVLSRERLAEPTRYVLALGNADSYPNLT
jgi:hypothetical protein